MEMPSIEKIKEASQGIGERHGLRLVVLYGSVAKGKAKEGSDVDLAVLGQSVLEFKEIIEIIDEFTAALQINEIYVNSLHRADPLFRQQVMGAGVLLYGDELDFIKFKTFAFRDYVESKSLFDLKEKMVKKRLGMLNDGGQ